MDTSDAFSRLTNRNHADGVRFDDASGENRIIGKEENAASADPLYIYYQSIKDTPLLTREQEVHLAKKIEDLKLDIQRLLSLTATSSVSDEPSRIVAQINENKTELLHARDRFFRSNMHLVLSIVKNYSHAGRPGLADLVQAGNIGLMAAIEKFNYRLEHDFSACATYWIRLGIERVIADQGWTSDTVDSSVDGVVEPVSQSGADQENHENLVAQPVTQPDADETARSVIASILDEDFCRSLDHMTLDEFLEFEKEISGVHNQSLYVASESMVRVDRNTFVADDKISFDVDATDDAIAMFVRGNVIPLQAVTSFTSFPCVDGYPWNWFLLESYCRRFSKRFGFQCLSVNSRNVGAIFRRVAGFADYIDVLAYAAAASNVNLNEKDVGDFLFESRYVAQRTREVQKVIEKARILRERTV